MLILNEKERCSEWAKERIAVMRGRSWGAFEAMGWEKNGELQAVVVFNYFSGCDIAMHVAAVPGRKWLNRAFLFAAFSYPFLQLNCRRITGYVPARSRDVLDFDMHLGFNVDGFMPHALPDDDVFVLGMLRENCPYIRGKYVPHNPIRKAA